MPRGYNPQGDIDEIVLWLVGIPSASTILAEFGKVICKEPT